MGESGFLWSATLATLKGIHLMEIQFYTCEGIGSRGLVFDPVGDCIQLPPETKFDDFKPIAESLFESLSKTCSQQLLAFWGNRCIAAEVIGPVPVERRPRRLQWLGIPEFA